MSGQDSAGRQGIAKRKPQIPWLRGVRSSYGRNVTESGSSTSQVVQNDLFDRAQFGLDLEHRFAALFDGRVGILETVAGQGTDHAAAFGYFAACDVVHSASERNGRSRLAKTAFLLGQEFLRRQDFFVTEFFKPALRFLLYLPSLVPGLRMADADGGGDRLGVVHP